MYHRPAEGCQTHLQEDEENLKGASLFRISPYDLPLAASRTEKGLLAALK